MNGETPVGQQRFITHLARLKDCFVTAAGSGNTALALYKTPARQYFFYLEALARIYRKLHNEKFFSGLLTEFKSLEDQLGKIDFYDAWIKEFSQQQNFPAVLLDYFKLHMDEEVNNLQKMLDENNWFENDFERIRGLSSELSQASWMDAGDDRIAIASFLDDELDNFKDDFKKGKFNFDDMEKGVHEFRRQLRWFSIYAQALDGLIQLQNTADEKDLKKYMTPEILNSPYNKLPAPKEGIAPIYIHSPNFYAMSWMVNEIGTLKDDGLRIHALTGAIAETKLKSPAEAEGYAASLASDNKYAISNIPKIVENMVDEFMNKNEVIKRMRKDVKRSMN